MTISNSDDGNFGQTPEQLAELDKLAAKLREGSIEDLAYAAEDIASQLENAYGHGWPLPPGCSARIVDSMRLADILANELRSRFSDDPSVAAERQRRRQCESQWRAEARRRSFRLYTRKDPAP